MMLPVCHTGGDAWDTCLSMRDVGVSAPASLYVEAGAVR
jgi:hypothetical protein